MKNEKQFVHKMKLNKTDIGDEAKKKQRRKEIYRSKKCGTSET